MKNSSLYIVIILLFALNSCTKEDSATPTASTTDDRDAYTGAWICTENATTSFTIHITKNGVSDTLRIENFAGYGAVEPQAFALVTGNSLTVPSQQITSTLINVQGTGVMNAAKNKITLTYTADGNNINAICIR